MNEANQRSFKWFPVMILVSIFQLITSCSVIFSGGETDIKLLGVFAAYVLLEWIYILAAAILFSLRHLELEIIGFFLSGIGLTVCASVSTGYALKQAVSIFLGIAVYIVMLAVLRRSDIVSALRTPVAVFAVALLVLNIVLAKTTNGTLNWIEIQGISIQP